jgi:Tfp pilus assembly protein PilF
MFWVRLPKKIFPLLSLLAMPVPVLCQGRNTVSVSGVVLSEGRHERIQHVVVRLCDSGGNLMEQATTSDTAEFSFRGLRRAPYILTFEAPGYEKVEEHVDLSFMSDRGITVYLNPVPQGATSPVAGASISAHELSMPEVARNLVASGRRKLYAEKNPQAGLEDFEQAVGKAPDYYEAYSEIAIADVTIGKTEEGIASFRKSIEVSHETYGDAYVGLGTLLVEKGEVDAGEKALRRGVELNPNSWRGFYELGKLDLGQNHLDLALRSAEHAKSLAPNVPVVYRLLTILHLRQGDYRAALEDIDAYLKRDPTSPAGVRAAEMREEIAKKISVQAASPTEPKP